MPYVSRSNQSCNSLRFRPNLMELESRETPAVAYALSNGSLLSFNDLASGFQLTSTAVTGIGTGESLVGIDVSPTNTQLYGLTYNGSGVRLYQIDPLTGAATALTNAPQEFTDGVNPVPISALNFGFDIDPVTAYARIVTNTDLNFRIDTRTGLIVDGDNGSATPVAGMNPDGPITGGVVTAAAYTNDGLGATVTTLYTLSGATGTLFIQNTPNSGNETAGIPITLNGTGVVFNADAGFDIPPGVQVTTANDPAAGTAYTVLTINDATGLYSLNLGTGALTSIGTIGTGASIQGFTLIGGGLQAFGMDQGGGTVNVFNADGSLRFTLQPFGASWTGGVRVATGDVNGDGVSDIIVAAGPGGGPRVVVYDGLTGLIIHSFFAYGSDFTGGVYVAAGDVNGDGYDDIITTPGAGGGPVVTVFSGENLSVLRNFFTLDSTFRGGTTVAAGDLNGDGLADIIIGAGPGGGPRVEAFQIYTPGVEGSPATPMFSTIFSIFAYDQNIPGGVYVGYGLDGGAPLVLTGTGSGVAGVVGIFDSAGYNLGSIVPYGSGFTGGIRVGSIDDSILTAPGPGGGPNGQSYDPSTLALTGSTYVFDELVAFGVFVS